MNLLYFPIIISLFGISFVLFLSSQIRKIKIAEDKAFAPSGLLKQFKTVSIVGAVLFFLLFLIGWKVSLGFLVGTVLSGLAVFMAENYSTQASLRVAEASKKGFTRAFAVSLNGGMTASLIGVSFALLAVSAFYFFTGDIMGLVGVAFGAGLISVFVKSGDCAGAAADVLSSCSSALVAAMILGDMLFPRSLQFVLLPLVLTGVSVLATIVGSFFAKISAKGDAVVAIYKGIVATMVLLAAGFYPVIVRFMAGSAIKANYLYFALLVGIVLAAAILGIYRLKTNSTALTVLVMALGIIISFALAGFYGIALAALGMVSVLGIMASSVAFGNISSNVLPELKGFTIVSAGLVSLVLFSAYIQEASVSGVINFVVNDARVVVGMLLGGLLPHLFISHLPEKKISASIPVLAPILVGLILGPQALGGMLIGAIITGTFSGLLTPSSVPAISPFIKTLPLVALLIVSFLI